MHGPLKVKMWSYISPLTLNVSLYMNL